MCKFRNLNICNRKMDDQRELSQISPKQSDDNVFDNTLKKISFFVNIRRGI